MKETLANEKSTKGNTSVVYAWLAPVLFALGFLRIVSVDFFWHLATGRWILAEGRLPRVDPFRFTSQEVPWVDHEWGFQVLVSLGESLLGSDGLTILRLGILTLVAIALLSALREAGASPALGVVAVSLVLLASKFRFFLRPELLSFLGFTILLWWLWRFRFRWSWWLGLLLMVGLWSNLHPGVLMAPVVVGAWLGARQIQNSRDPWWTPMLGGTVALGGTVLNPWGWHLWRVPGEIAASLRDLPAMNPDWASFGENPQWLTVVILAVTLAVSGESYRRSRVWHAPSMAVVAVLLPLAYVGARHSIYLNVALAGAAAPALAAMQWVPQGFSHRFLSRLLPAVVALGAVLIGFSESQAPLNFGYGVTQDRFPDGPLETLMEDWSDVGPLFHAAPFGGYILWKLHGEREIFWDTRNEVNPSLMGELGRAREDPTRWFAFLEKWKIDAALVRYEALQTVSLEGEQPRSRGVSPFFFPSDQFALVDFDDVSLFFVKRTPEREERLRRREYRALNPEDWMEVLLRADQDPRYRRAVLREVRRKLEEDPSCGRATEFLSRLGG